MVVGSLRERLGCGGKDKGALPHLKLTENSPRGQEALCHILEGTTETQLSMIPKVMFLFVYLNWLKTFGLQLLRVKQRKIG